MSNLLIMTAAEEALRTRLAVSFQTAVNGVCAQVGCPAPAFDFTEGGNQFFGGQYNIEELVKDSTVLFPVVMLYSGDTARDGSAKPAQFDGHINVNLNIWLESKPAKPNALTEFHRQTRAVGDAYLSMMGERANQNWGRPLMYSGLSQVVPGVRRLGGRGWWQLLITTSRFRLLA